MRVPKAADMSGVAHGVSVYPRAEQTTWSESLASPLKLRRQACAWCQRGLPLERGLGEIHASMSTLDAVAFGAHFLPHLLPLQLSAVVSCWFRSLAAL